MRFSGRIEIVYGLEGQLTDTWQEAWRAYEWDADDEHRPDLHPQLRVTEQGPEVWFEWEEGCLEYDLSAITTAVDACSHGFRNARALEELYQQEDEESANVDPA
jgi:hypothetical protein